MELMKEDLRYLRTRTAILNAARELICLHPPGKITVSELTKRAQIHRKSFYLHYRDIEDLFDDIVRQVADGFIAAMRTAEESCDGSMSFEVVNRVFFSYYAAQEPYVDRLVCSPEYSFLFEKITDMELAHNIDRYDRQESPSVLQAEEKDMVHAFCVGSSLVMYRKWTTEGRRIPLEDMIRLSGTLLTRGINGFDAPPPAKQ